MMSIYVTREYLSIAAKFDCIFCGPSESFPYTCFSTVTIDLYFIFLCIVLNELLSALHMCSAGMIFISYIFCNIQVYTQSDEQCFRLLIDFDVIFKCVLITPRSL